MIDYIQHINTAISKAKFKQSKLTPEALSIYDKDSCMSSHTVRHLMNNLCNFEGCNYCEVGNWRGSILGSAIFNNQIKATAIDYWPEIGPYRETRTIFHRNLYSLLALETGGMYKDLRIINEDCFVFNKLGLNNINVYLYDADHSKESQYKGIEYYNDILSDIAIILVDDYNSIAVQEGTQEAFKALKYNILSEWILEGNSAEQGWFAEMDKFWNGFYIGLIKK